MPAVVTVDGLADFTTVIAGLCAATAMSALAERSLAFHALTVAVFDNGLRLTVVAFVALEVTRTVKLSPVSRMKPQSAIVAVNGGVPDPQAVAVPHVSVLPVIEQVGKLGDTLPVTAVTDQVMPPSVGRTSVSVRPRAATGPALLTVMS